MIKTFEDVAFGLQNEGDFSDPFASDYGWHILKLLEKYPIPPYDELHAKLESKVKNGSRSSYVEKSLAEKISADYKVVTYKAKLQLFQSIRDYENRDDTLLIVQDVFIPVTIFLTMLRIFKRKRKRSLMMTLPMQRSSIIIKSFGRN